MVKRSHDNAKQACQAMGNGATIAFLEKHDNLHTDIQCIHQI
jgi:hypothetical protein